jgi:hypothetical protein
VVTVTAFVPINQSTLFGFAFFAIVVLADTATTFVAVFVVNFEGLLAKT